MIEIEINEDVRKYKTKLIGPFTTRQVICLILGSITIVGIAQYLKPILTSDLTTFICMVVAVPFMAVGWIEPYGMKMEDFARTAFISLALAPSIRKFEHTNSYNAQIRNGRKKKKTKISKKIKSIK